tara:strand:- start:1209 stop:2069 length:861 start_codon:yes stop_codon:yes gene_type:complete
MGSNSLSWNAFADVTCDQVVFSHDKLFKKGVALDGTSCWLEFSLKEDSDGNRLFQWAMTDNSPDPNTRFIRKYLDRGNSLLWNFILREEEDKYDLIFFHGQSSLRHPVEATRWERQDFWKYHMSWSGGKTHVGTTEEFHYGEFNQEFAEKSFLLRDLPIYMGNEDTWSCVGESEEDWSSSDEGQQAEQVEPEEQVEAEQADQADQEERVEPEEHKEKKRQDPFDKNLYFTKKEFKDYYGSTIQWNFMKPENVFKREIIGKWIDDNEGYMRVESINHLLDELFKTFN